MSQEKPGTPGEPENTPQQPETTPDAPEVTPAETDATETAPAGSIPVPEATPASEVPVAPVAPGAAAQAGFGAAAGYGLAAPVAEDEVEFPVIARAEGPSLAARLGAEAFGTFVLVLAGLGTALYASYTGAGALGVALAFGLAAGAAHLAIGRVSGGHLNPAITLGSALAGRTRFAHLLPYWVAQFVGAALASAVLYLPVSTFPALESAERQFFSSTANGFNENSPLALSTGSTEGFTWIAALLVEVVVSAILVGVFLAVTGRSHRDRTHTRQAAAGYGAALAVAVLIATPVTNAGLNPARSVAAAIFSESWAWGQVWVFLVGPLVGALLAALLYRGFGGGDEADELDEELADDVLIEDEVVAEVR